MERRAESISWDSLPRLVSKSAAPTARAGCLGEVIWARVQAHPSRRDLLPDLLARLKPLPVEVMFHESVPPDPWAGYRACLKNIPDCTHLLIVQDDAQPTG